MEYRDANCRFYALRPQEGGGAEVGFNAVSVVRKIASEQFGRRSRARGQMREHPPWKNNFLKS
jgi:hypothetical protein